MEVYNISADIPIKDRMVAGGQFAKDVIGSYLTRYDNVSYLSQFNDGSGVKTLFDIGLNNLAFGFYTGANSYSIGCVLSKKEDTDSTDRIATNTGSQHGSSTSDGTRFNVTLRVIARDNKLIAVSLGRAGYECDGWLVIDNDNYGRNYVMFNTATNVYFDNDNSYTPHQLYNANTAISNPMEGIVLESLLYIYSSSTGIVGLSSSLKSMMNYCLPTKKGSTIDVAGVKYVAMTMKDATAHNNVWVYDKEYQ